MKANKKIILLLIFSACNFFILRAGNINHPGDTEKNKREEINQSNQTSFALVNNSSDTDIKLKLINLQFDAAGFIFYGPQLALDFQIANILAIGPFFRWNYAGVLYHVAMTDGFTTEASPTAGSYGIGVGAKILPPIGSGKHRPYIDLGFEKFRGKEGWDPGGTWGKHYYEYKSNIFHVGAGYRLTTDASFNLSVGIFIAIAKETENKDYYEFGDEVVYHSLSGSEVYPGIQLLLGWQLGGN